MLLLTPKTDSTSDAARVTLPVAAAVAAPAPVAVAAAVAVAVPCETPLDLTVTMTVTVTRRVVLTMADLRKAALALRGELMVGCFRLFLNAMTNRHRDVDPLTRLTKENAELKALVAQLRRQIMAMQNKGTS